MDKNRVNYWRPSVRVLGPCPDLWVGRPTEQVLTIVKNQSIAALGMLAALKLQLPERR